MTFTESNTVEAYLRDLLCGILVEDSPLNLRDTPAGYGVIGAGIGWTFLPAVAIPREPQDVFSEPLVREALIRLNPEIAAHPDRADEVLYKLRAIVLSVRSDGLIRANEEFTAWLRGERSMPFGKDGEHVTVRLLDFDDLAQNQYLVTTQYLFRAGPAERRADLVLLINGLPLVLIEAKTPVRPSVSWVDGAIQVHTDYEQFVPELFACNVFSVASEGKELRYGSIRMPVQLWGPWRPEDEAEQHTTPSSLASLEKSIGGLLAPATVLDILASFTLFATDKKKRRIKVVCRYQQYEGANRIVARVLAGYPKKGLIWHFQGSGKSLLMVFAAQKLRMHPKLKNPTVLIVVDRIDLDTQISATFHGADIPNLVKAEKREELKTLLRQDTRKIIITTIFKFGEETPRQTVARLLKQIPELVTRGELVVAQQELGVAYRAVVKFDDSDKREEARDALRTLADTHGLSLTAADSYEDPQETALAAIDDTASASDSPVLNDRDNIIALVDEAHRTQEGDLGMKMRAALPNAFLFGLTGTPINKRDRNTFYAFGAPEDSNGYLSHYGFEDSIRDGATLPLHFEPRLVELHIDNAAIDAAYKTLTGSLSDLDRDNLAKTAAKMAVLVKAPKRINAICEDIAKHFQASVAPNGFKAMVVTFDQECCLLYKAELDKRLPEAIQTDIVISVHGKEKDDARYKPYKRDRDAEEALLDRFRDPNDPLSVLVVTAKLLTGFDAPILQAMYLDKPLRDHTLLQAITRTNRTFSGSQSATKSHGLIVDYLGVFDDVAKALEFDEAGFQKVASNIAALKSQLPAAMQKCLAYFHGVDRSLAGYEGLVAAQNARQDWDGTATPSPPSVSASVLRGGALPDPLLQPCETDYRWLVQIYESLKPSTGQGALIWHVLGAKTVQLIHDNVKVGTVRDDLDELVFDADVIEAILDAPDKKKKTKEIEIKIAARLRKHLGNPRFKPLSVRLEQLRERHEAGQLHSVAFLKQLLELAIPERGVGLVDDQCRRGPGAAQGSAVPVAGCTR
ncbi:type I restriction endonuclease [Lamprobacter modestohalophilus]|uniref:type I restriction endonuclease subunit R n=3 Tax=Lamprobacter modestohalophilus TaxID=1064514 RepID=UPI002ADEF379|nr:type I restriction endonuclease [Lamprobacter modestohalophilus]MEA1052900.1 type I restriction endonuclease [Lamprobacter modestohalophilus]